MWIWKVLQLMLTHHILLQKIRKNIGTIGQKIRKKYWHYMSKNKKKMLLQEQIIRNFYEFHTFDMLISKTQ